MKFSFLFTIALVLSFQMFGQNKPFKGNSKLPGVDFSDHLNYWKFNIEVVMITNTAFYRNKNYHTFNDTLKTVDLKKMLLLIQQLYAVIKLIK